MEIPRVSRPYMPGYGIAGPTEGSGLLHWSWAAERLTAARNYWVATVWPDGRPHIMPVWGMWDDSTLWFTSSAGPRKGRNLTTDPRCCATAEHAPRRDIVERPHPRHSATRSASAPAGAQPRAPRALPGAVAGMLAAAVAIGAAQLVAGLTAPASSPVLAVGQTAIDLTPQPVKDFAISAFG